MTKNFDHDKFQKGKIIVKVDSVEEAFGLLELADAEFKYTDEELKAHTQRVRDYWERFSYFMISSEYRCLVMGYDAEELMRTLTIDWYEFSYDEYYEHKLITGIVRRMVVE